MNRIVIIVFVLVSSISYVSAQKFGKTPADSVACITNQSLYSEFFKQRNYNEAVKSWRQVVSSCPAYSENTYIRGNTIIKQLIATEKNLSRKEQLIDTLMLLHDMRITYFGKEGVNLGRKGIDLLTYRPNNIEEVYTYLAKSVAIENQKTTPDVIVVYMQAVVKLIEAGKKEKVLCLEVYDQLSTIIELNMKSNQTLEVAENYSKALVNIETLASPYLTCTDLVAIYTKKLEQNPADLSNLKKITSIMFKANCTETDLFSTALKSQHKLEPTATTAFFYGKLMANKKQYSEAITYLEEALTLYTPEDDKTNAYLLLVDAYRNAGQLVKARSVAQKFLSINPNSAMGYILLGDIYMSASANCGETDISKVGGYWVAADMYQKARNLDPSLSKVAGEKLSAAAARFPSKETIFFHNLKEGDSYTVECWIGETTRVRAR